MAKYEMSVYFLGDLKRGRRSKKQERQLTRSETNQAPYDSHSGTSSKLSMLIAMATSHCASQTSMFAVLRCWPLVFSRTPEGRKQDIFGSL